MVTPKKLKTRLQSIGSPLHEVNVKLSEEFLSSTPQPIADPIAHSSRTARSPPPEAEAYEKVTVLEVTQLPHISQNTRVSQNDTNLLPKTCIHIQ